MARKYRVAGASILAAAIATAALSGSSCTIKERGQGGGSSVSGGPPATCVDGIKNVDETDYDCGGSCKPCKDGKECLMPDDCESNVCDGMVCATPSCADGARNGAETDIDCGASCTERCADGKVCGTSLDCTSTFCNSGVCVAQCDNMAKDGDETDVDCGGSCMGKCADGKTCKVVSDCSSNRCVDGVCASCTNKAKDGDETDLDCGGTCATKCSVERDCKVSADCVSGTCSGDLCVADQTVGNTCFDGAKNGFETSQDCGGGACNPCNVGEGCSVDSDCYKKLKCAPGLKTCQWP